MLEDTNSLDGAYMLPLKLEKDNRTIVVVILKHHASNSCRWIDSVDTDQTAASGSELGYTVCPDLSGNVGSLQDWSYQQCLCATGWEVLW